MVHNEFFRRISFEENFDGVEVHHELLSDGDGLVGQLFLDLIDDLLEGVAVLGETREVPNLKCFQLTTLTGMS